MESRRFDSFVRALANGSSRRGILRGAVVASTAALVPAAVRADAGSVVSGNGASGCSPCVCGSGSNPCSPCVCASDRPPRQVTAAPPFPAVIVSGSCDKYDASKGTYDLSTVGAALNKPQSQNGVISVVRGQTSLNVSLTDLLATGHALIVQASATDETLVACGNLGAKSTSGALAIGLKERNGSGYSGIADLASGNNGTSVNVMIARGLFETTSDTTSAAFAVGSNVIAQSDINLRATASDTGKVVAILGEGSELKVTGAAQGKWLPVDDVASGDSGFVNSEYVVME